MLPAITILWCLAALTAASVESGSEPDSFDLTIGRLPVGMEVHRPASGRVTSHTILLLHGGLNTDIHWTTPATATDGDGINHQLTTTGEPTRDADTLTAALVDAGYSVLRYGSIPDGVDPANAPPIDFDQSLAIARAALDAFRERHAYHPGKLILLGHSLGATRAAALINDDITSGRFDVAGFVALAGAYMSNTAESPRRLSSESLARHASDPITAARDLDDDGTLQGWELAFALEQAGEINLASERPVFREGVPWPIDVIATSNVPTLTLYGSLDPVTLHAPRLTAAVSKQALTNLDVQLLTGLGHNLAPLDEQGRTGPIARDPIDRVIRWLEARFPGE